MASLKKYRSILESGLDDKLLAIDRLSELASSLGHQLLETKRTLDEARIEICDLSRRTAIDFSQYDTSRLSEMEKTLDKLLTISEVCEHFGVGRHTLWRLRRSGSFPNPVTVTSGRKAVRYRASDIEKWLLTI